MSRLESQGPPPYEQVYPRLTDIDLRADATRLDVPVHLVQGGHETRGRAELVTEWFDRLAAPRKQVVVRSCSPIPPGADDRFGHANERRAAMKPSRVVLLVLGSLVALMGFGLLAGGATLGWALASQRDSAGFFSTPVERFATDSAAVTFDDIDLGEPGVDEWWATRDLATVRIGVDSATSADLFVGIGPEADVEAYLAGVPHDKVTNVRYRPFAADYRHIDAAGQAVPAAPGEQTSWVAKASGSGAQTLTWDIAPGRWAVVVMNADGSPGVGADVTLAGRTDFLVPLAGGLGLFGVLLA
ncbi:MAG TPA: hypothetical protein VHM65_01390, partial [Candidatus Lustribacter sp.]|nr:hypothetical protein [Candidatus Lustribacter sp.]